MKYSWIIGKIVVELRYWIENDKFSISFSESLHLTKWIEKFLYLSHYCQKIYRLMFYWAIAWLWKVIIITSYVVNLSQTSDYTPPAYLPHLLLTQLGHPRLLLPKLCLPRIPLEPLESHFTFTHKNYPKQQIWLTVSFK